MDERGEVSLKLDGGGGDREPGIIVYSPRGPESAVTILVRRDTGRAYIMANTAAGSRVVLTFDHNEDPEVHLRDTDGIDRTLGL